MRKSAASCGCILIVLPLIEERIKPDETLAVLPEGVILNFLSGRDNPVSYTTYGSGEVMIFGEDKILASFESVATLAVQR